LRTRREKIAVNEAASDYLAFLEDTSKDIRGENTGIFARFRHGEAGKERAETFNRIINEAQDHKAMIREIIDFLEHPKTKFHNHSFATYLLDKLLRVFPPDAIKPVILTSATPTRDQLKNHILHALTKLWEFRPVALLR